MRSKFILPACFALLTGLCTCAPPPSSTAPTAPAAYGALPTEAQLEWQEMEMNAFIHFTTNTFTDLEWGYGDEDPALFDPTDLDVDQWMETLKEAGFKGVILTAKHHDGFVLWPSAYTDHSVAASPWKEGKGDLVGMVEEAARRHDLKFGIYLSPWDRNRADYGDSTYITYYRAQVRELFENYGPIFEMWLDGANGGDGYYGSARETRSIDGEHYYDWPTTVDMVRELQPDPATIIFSDAGPDIRWVGNERGVVGDPNWNTIDTDTLYAGKPGIGELLGHGTPGADTWLPAEVDVSIRPGWFYHAREDSLVKSPQELFDIYLTSVGRGSPLLLNVPPDRRGLIHETDVAALRGWRSMIDSVFADDLTAGATISADHYRGQHEDYAPQLLLDDDPQTYWATDDGTTTGRLTITLPETREINYLLLQEPIRLGQRVADFRVLARVDGELREIGRGNTVGYKRILPLEAVTTDEVVVEITDALAPPLLSRLSLY